MITKEVYEQIESYLNGQMSAPDKKAFEYMLLQDTHLAAEVQHHHTLKTGFAVYGNRNRLKNQMEAFHHEWKEENKHQPFIYTYGVQAFWRRHVSTMAVAASVAVITVFSTVWVTNYLRSLEKKQISYYAQLRKENTSIKKTLNDISAAVSQQQNERQARFTATGFMITSSGYIVTNRHVVEEADSIYVEAQTADHTQYRYKVKVIPFVNPDDNVDLALLKITDPSFKPLARLPYAIQMREADLGEKVYTLAYPREDMVYGEGSVSAHTGYEGDTVKYQISIPVNPGNSGAPLLDEHGNLIGIISGKNINEDGAAFAVKAKHLLAMIKAIPTDSLTEQIILPRKNSIHTLRRPEQIHKLQELVFNVKVYKSDK